MRLALLFALLPALFLLACSDTEPDGRDAARDGTTRSTNRDAGADFPAVDGSAHTDSLDAEFRPVDLEGKPIPLKPPPPVIVRDVMVKDARVLDNEPPPEPPPTPDEGLASDVPFDGPPTGAPIGVTVEGRAFRGRRDAGLRSRHGGRGTEHCVALGLEWLAAHQDPGGFWDCEAFMKMDRITPICDGSGNPLYDPGVTGLALLAFLGDGHTHKHGEHRKAVRNALRYLKKIQHAEGCFGNRDFGHFTYNHAIATLAMAEAYGMTFSPLFKRSAQAGVDFAHKCQNPYLAWRYGVRPKDNDTSVSAWMTMALWTAKQSGLRVDPAGFDGMRAWLDKVTEPLTGRAGYFARGAGPTRPEDLLDSFPAEKSEAMTAAGVLSRILIGEDPRASEMVRKGANRCLKAAPVWDEAQGTIDMVYWFFGTAALFQVGGNAWERWNRSMKDAVMPNQRRGGSFRGSWDPIGVWGRDGGRVYSTALMTLTLETYTRHARIFDGPK